MKKLGRREEPTVQKPEWHNGLQSLASKQVGDSAYTPVDQSDGERRIKEAGVEKHPQTTADNWLLAHPTPYKQSVGSSGEAIINPDIEGVEFIGMRGVR